MVLVNSEILIIQIGAREIWDFLDWMAMGFLSSDILYSPGGVTLWLFPFDQNYNYLLREWMGVGSCNVASKNTFCVCLWYFFR